ncbi:DEAD/DEAH box helicase [Mesobaculum littorinae]|uniref:DEAD/DEAH box helicase n=1 Tax=Mesobaculum littorinae TaxID=2486419 RepID=A0A438ALE0_9RHOB|nr:DEAD/DEAH box helicase [Mesobaculum littorinae]RVV99492.1 DEAD/DEAH box helicase [Mesobaculum littorinae]
MIQTLSDALSERGYDTLTPVQEAVTDPGLAEADLLVSAQTGSGKTVGFGLAIGRTLLGDAEVLGEAGIPLALIVAPTRELAFQVSRELGWLYAKAGARVVSCVGGMDMRDERRALDRGAHIVVGTPGRLRDHIQRGSLDMTGLRAVVLDEADEMLDLGFREDLEFMLGEAPEDRRTLLFSATVPPMIATLAQNYQRDAVRVTTLSERSQHADIAYQALRVAQQDAENAIINVLRYHEAQNAIVFANTRATVNRLTARFANRGFAVVSLSGELSQTERSHALQAMRDGRARVCVATDVAARGIDLPNLELVIHAELPSNAEGLLHRSGRTGRAGRKGTSALIVPPKATKRAERLLKTARVTAEWTTAPGADEILRRDEERLLADPVWSDEITEAEAEFSERLVAQQSPERIAAAYLRLYRTKHSAPEDLGAPDARAPAKERAPFGPSVWVALSVGRDQRAEPRWILPLLCRAGGLDKTAIGAIRVQDTETFVELTEASVERFLTSLGPGGQLEEGVAVRRLDGPPDTERPPRASGGPRPDRKPAGPRPDRKFDPAGPDRSEVSRPAGAGAGDRGDTGGRAAPAPRAESAETSDRPARAPRDSRPPRDAEAPRERQDPEGAVTAWSKPRKGKDSQGGAKYGGAPRKEGGGKPSFRDKGAPKEHRRDGPGGAPGKGGRPDRGPRAAGETSDGKPKYGKPRAGKPAAGNDARPGRGDGAPAGRRPSGAAASDTSKRFVPPHKAGAVKGAGKGAGKGAAKAPGGRSFGGKPDSAGRGPRPGKPAGGPRGAGGGQPPRRKG